MSIRTRKLVGAVALLALVIAPIATELPEKFNSVIWIRQRKDTLAMGNITGARQAMQAHLVESEAVMHQALVLREGMPR